MKNLKQLLISDKASIKDVIYAINKADKQIIFVTNSFDQVIGTISDGDIRRAILSELNFNQSVSDIMNINFRKIYSHENSSMALSIMKKEKLSHIPVIDSTGKLKDIIILEDFVKNFDKKLSNTIVLMAGGQGKRLLPLTKNIPKPMLKINGKPMIETLIEKCAEDGFENFIISVNYKKEIIQEYFSNGKKWGVNIVYQAEDKQLGTAGSLSLIKERQKINYPLIVINADIITPLSLKNLIDFHSKAKSKGTVCTMSRVTHIPFGVVHSNQGVINSFQEKPSLVHNILAGIYVLEKELIDNLQYNIYCDMPDFLNKSVKNYKLVTFPLHEYWLDAGLPENFATANTKK